MIGYITYTAYRRSKLLVGKRTEMSIWVFSHKESCVSYCDMAKVSFDRQDVEEVDSRDQSFYVNHLTLIELV